MKKRIVSVLVSLSVMILLSGCLALNFGGGTTSRGVSPTVGQRLIDLQKAKDAGAITDAQYQKEKAKILNENCK